MLVEQLAGSGFNALVFNYVVAAFKASQGLFIAALATFMLSSAVVPGILLPLLKRWDVSDMRLMYVGLVGMGVAFGLIAFFVNVYVFFTAAACLGLGALIAPAAFSIVSSRVSDSDQGLAQGAFSSVTSLSAVLAQVTFDSLFIVGNTKFHDPGFAFYFALGFSVLAIGCAHRLGRALASEPPPSRSATAEYVKNGS